MQHLISRLIALALWLTTSCHSWSQYSLIHQSGDIRAAGMSQTGVVMGSPTTAMNNPAHAVFLNPFQLGVISHPYIRNGSLSFLSITAGMKLSSRQGIGVYIQREGSGYLNEILAGIGFGQKIGAQSSIGIGLSLLSKQFPESMNSLGLIPEIGIQTKLNSSISLGVLVRNPIPIEIQKGVLFQSDYRLGFCYEPSQGLLIYFGAQKSGEFPMNGHLGLEYQLRKAFSIRMGAKTLGSFSFGAGLNLKNQLSIDLAADLHFQIGPRFGIGLNWGFSK
ncbi:MAG: hypothetical protein IPM48_11570 [Saprospiraceae bacterium]|nr:hypothetical protein [Saprospiraceae bacterium]